MRAEPGGRYSTPWALFWPFGWVFISFRAQVRPENLPLPPVGGSRFCFPPLRGLFSFGPSLFFTTAGMALFSNPKGEQRTRLHYGSAYLHPLLSLEMGTFRSPCQHGRSLPPWNGRHLDSDRQGIPRFHAMETLHLSIEPQPHHSFFVAPSTCF